MVLTVTIRESGVEFPTVKITNRHYSDISRIIYKIFQSYTVYDIHYDLDSKLRKIRFEITKYGTFIFDRKSIVTEVGYCRLLMLSV